MVLSPSVSFVTGMPVQREMILAISSSVTASCTRLTVAFFDLFFLDLKLLLEFRQFAVLQFGSFFQIVVLFCFLNLFVDILDLLT